MSGSQDTVSNAEWHRVLRGMFGKKFEIFPDVSGVVPAIDILAFKPTRNRDFWTLVTSGLSKIRMVPPDGSDIPRIELALYAEEPDEGLIQLLWWLASTIRDNGHWLVPGSTMTNGEPPESLFDDSSLDSFAFIQPLLEPDFTVPSQYSVDGVPVVMLWTLPISSAEREYLKDHDVSEFYSLLEQNGHAVVFNVPRESYV